MKNITLLLLLISGIAPAQIVNIPDANFKAKLLSASPTNQIAYGNGAYIEIDANSDGQIQLTEAIVVDSLNVRGIGIGLNIGDLTGISDFTNLKKLDVSWNSISSLDLSALGGLRYLDFSRNDVATFDATPLSNLETLSCYMNPLVNLNLNGLSNLKMMHCASTQLTGIDASTLVNLRILYCYSNQFSTLDLTSCPLLEVLNCSEDHLTSLNIAGLSNLQYLDCSTNQLASLNLTGLSGIIDLTTNDNMLTALNLSDLINLKSLACYTNQLTALDFTGLLQFNSLYCSNNLLTTLDFSGNPQFDDIFCNDNLLTSVNIKNGFMMTNVDSNFSNNPNLNFICVDDSESEIVDDILSWTNPDVNFNSYCSFLDGGSFNTITGTLLFDHDNNGCDTGDFYNPYLKLNINDGVTTSSTFTDTAGNYTFQTQSGSFTLTPQIENPSFFTFTPANAVVNFPAVNNSVTTQNFCVTPNGVHPDLEITMPWFNWLVPGLETPFTLVYHNKGNQSQSGSINLNFDDDRMDFISAQPAINGQAINTLIWNYSDLQPFETRYIQLTLKTNSSMQTPPVNIGDILNFTSTINPIAGDATPADNVFNSQPIVVNSYDPNTKVCLEGATVTPDDIGNYLHYNINFENIGTSNAINIVIKDTINTAKFEINSLQLQYASHAVETKIKGNIVEFIFKNINLPPSDINPIGGHGNVLFKIKTLGNLNAGDEVSNTANIFFDYNAPIQTNEARTTFALLSKSGFMKDNSIIVSPIPTKNIINISAATSIKSVQLFDVQGRILQTVIGNKKDANLDISGKQNGVYFLKIITRDGTNIEKIIKD